MTNGGHPEGGGVASPAPEKPVTPHAKDEEREGGKPPVATPAGGSGPGSARGTRP